MKKPCRFLRRPPAPARAIQGEQWLWTAEEQAGIAVTEATALQLPSVLSTVAVLATDVAVLPLRVYQRLRNGNRRDAPDHPVDRILARSPDGETTAIRWRQAWMGHALQHGNGYGEIQRRGDGRPYALHLLDPCSTRPERRDGRPGYASDGAWLPASNVLHLAGFGFDGLCGYNFTRLIREAIAVGLAAQGYGADYFANGAEPGGIIEYPGKLSREAIGNLRAGWDEKHQGKGNRHRPAVLDNGAKWHGTSTDPEKSQLLETRKFQVNDVTRPWRVPPHKIGDYSQAHLANIEASNLDYLMTALVGWLEAIEQECNLKLFTPAEAGQGFYVEHNTAALLRGDTAGRYAAYGQALNDGWMNRDEVRRRENLNPIGKKRGGRKFLVQGALVPLENAGAAYPDATTTVDTTQVDPGAPGDAAGADPDTGPETEPTSEATDEQA